MKFFRFSIDNVRALQLFQVIRFGSLMVINIAIVKLGLSATHVGFYESTLFLANLLTFFWLNGSIQAFLPIYPKTSASERHSALFNVALTLTMLSLASGGVGFLLEGLLRKTETIGEFPYFGLAMAYTILSSMGQLNEYIYLLRDKPIQMLAYGAISHSVQIACVVIPLLYKPSIELALFGLLIVSLVRIAWLAALIYRFSEIRFQPGFIKQWFRQSFPLSVKFLLGNSANFADTIIITTFFSTSVFALYRYGAKDFPLTLLLANGLSAALLPLMGENLEQGLAQLRNRSRNLIVWLFPISAVLMFAARPLYALIFSAEFETSGYVFMVYLLLISSRLVFPQTVAIGLGKTKPLLVIACIELAVNISLSLLWMKTWGIEGIAMATVVAFAIEKALIALYLLSKHRIKPSQYIPLKEYTIWLIVLAGSYLAARFLIV